MKETEKKGNTKQSLFAEILMEIFDLFIGNLTSKMGWALILLVVGLLLLFRPFIDNNGTQIEKSYIPYIIGSVLIIISIGLVISWIRERNATNIS